MKLVTSLAWRRSLSCLGVLVANSDAGKRSALVDVLAQFDLEPMTVTSLEEVRVILAQQVVHLVFCEDALPGGGFREVLRLAQATRSGVPLVVSSRLCELEEYLEAMQLGALDFIAPPYRPSEVESIVNSVLQNCSSKRMGGTHFNIQADAVSRGDETVA
jgi:two-component system, response regulator FlrC